MDEFELCPYCEGEHIQKDLDSDYVYCKDCEKTFSYQEIIIKGVE